MPYKRLKIFVNKEVKKCQTDSNLVKENRNNASALWKTLNEITSLNQTAPVSCIKADGFVYFENASMTSISQLLRQNLQTNLVIAYFLQDYSSDSGPEEPVR